MLLLLSPLEVGAARQRLLSMMIASLPLPSLCGFGFDDFRAESFSLSVNRAKRRGKMLLSLMKMTQVVLLVEQAATLRHWMEPSA